ncbi:UNVERIFIED_CONTAM: hypothetical protein GTU68_015062 [Idotea baltica]|nr:hypothetical protein [Idotea baltica]
MKIVTTEIDDLIIIEPAIWSDSRGYFFESFQAERYEKAGIDVTFVQDNEAFSSKGVLRGLHYQVPPFAQDKLVRVISGSILDVAVDIRSGSPTYGQYCSVMLSGENKKQFFVPGGFAHGYICLTDDVVFAYKCSNYYSKDHEGGIRYDDPSIGIDWQFDLTEAVISEKDLILPNFGDHRKWPK